jgi:prolycopene isomerase
MLISLIDSAWYCRGSFQQLVDALVVALKRNGGELVVGQRVSRILVEDGRVTGVTLQNGRHIRATAVVSNVDARQTFEDLVGAEHLPQQFLRRLRRLKISLSACVVFAATKANLTEFHPAHETFIYKHWDHDATYQDILDGKPGGMWIDIPTHLDPSLAPPGEHLAIITSLAQYDLGVPWEQERARFEEQLLSETEILFPGFRDQLTFVETATPLTLERYTLNHQGAIYGWDYSTSQIGSRRPDHQTPITGLYLSGHWTQPGATSLRVLSSGIHTAQLILRNPKLGELSPTFEHADLPSV